MKFNFLYSILFLFLFACETSYDSSKELSINIQIEGEDISKLNWKFSKNENTFASFGQKLIYWGPLKKLENVLLRSQIAPWAFWASNIYHNLYWRNLVGKPRIKKAMKTSWGKLFKSY